MSAHPSRSRSSVSPARKSSLNWRRAAKRLALTAALGTAMVAGGRALYPLAKSRAEQRVNEEQRVMENNLRYRDLIEAKKTFEEWKGIRDLDDIVYDLAASFPERRAAREAARRAFQPRGIPEPLLEEADQEIARRSPEEIQSYLRYLSRSGMSKQELADNQLMLVAMRNEVATYLEHARARAPERVRKKLEWMYGELFLGSGAFAAGLYLAIARALRKRRLPLDLVKKYALYSVTSPYSIRRQNRRTLAYAKGNRILVQETSTTLDSKRQTEYEEGEVREYDMKGKLITKRPIGHAFPLHWRKGQ